MKKKKRKYTPSRNKSRFTQNLQHKLNCLLHADDIPQPITEIFADAKVILST